PAARRPLGREGDHLEPLEPGVAPHGRVVRCHDREAGARRQLRDQRGRESYGAGGGPRVRAACREDDRRRAMIRRAGLILLAGLLAGRDPAGRADLCAQRTVDAGFTTVRDVGAGAFIDVALRNAISEGAVPGPRMLVSTMPLSATGGHGDVNGMSPYLHFDGFSGIANGVDQIREKIRFEVKYGADLIKVLASAGVLSEEESVGAPQYTQEELNAVVEEAAMWGRKVAAHAHGA